LTNTASGTDTWVGGGENNRAAYPYSSVSGGNGNTTNANASSILGGLNETLATTNGSKAGPTGFGP
jgi:hypothetical protein